MPSDPSNIILNTVLIVLLIILNGIVVLFNTAIDSVSRNKIKSLVVDEENPKAIKLVNLLEKPLTYLYTNRLLNFIFLLIAFTMTLMTYDYNEFVIIIVFAATVFIFDEVLPRKIALSHREAIALSFVDLQTFLCLILKPIVWLLLLISNIFLKILRQETDVDDGEFSEEEVMSMLEVGQESGVLKEEGKKMINSIFAFDDELAYEIMTPRTDVFLIDINDPTEEYLDELMELRYSRIPVCENETDNIIGILHIKDYLIKAREDGFENVDIRGILRKPYFVPDTKNIDALFFELQKSRQHIAILIDEYGGFSGIVTMEDIIEEVMGDIDDEYDEEENSIERLDENTFILDGNLPLDDLDDELNLSLESDTSETIGGFLIDILGEIPKEDDINRTIEYQNFIFRIISVKDRRIEKIKMYIWPKVISENDSENNNHEE